MIKNSFVNCSMFKISNVGQKSQYLCYRALSKTECSALQAGMPEGSALLISVLAALVTLHWEEICSNGFNSLVCTKESELWELDNPAYWPLLMFWFLESEKVARSKAFRTHVRNWDYPNRARTGNPCCQLQYYYCGQFGNFNYGLWNLEVVAVIKHTITSRSSSGTQTHIFIYLYYQYTHLSLFYLRQDISAHCTQIHRYTRIRVQYRVITPSTSK